MERFGWLEIRGDSERSEGEKREQSFDALEHLQQAERAYKYGSYERAMREYAKALGQDAARADAWLGQVNCLLELEELNEARIWVDKALDRFPENPELMAAKALVLARCGDAEEAATIAGRAIKKLDPSPYVWLLRGLTLLCIDPRKAGRTCFLKALEGGDGDGAIALRIGMGFLRHKDYASAKEYLACTVEKDPRNPLAWHMLGRCCEGLFAYARAARCYERALDMRPDFRDDVLAGIGRVRTRGFFSRLIASVRLAWGE